MVNPLDQDDNKSILDHEYDDRFNRAKELKELEKLEGLRNHPDAQAAREGLSSKTSEDIQTQEESQTYPWANKVSPKATEPKKRGFVGSLRNSKTGPIGLILALLIPAGLITVAIVPLMLSLKMFGMAANMTDAASSIPAYAVERRTEYIMTRMFATWLIRSAPDSRLSDADSAAVFCNGASIGCSLKWTYINEYFDSRYELSNWGDSTSTDGNRIRKVTFAPKGRDSLGSFARSWEMNVEMDLGPNTVTRQMDTITSNPEMKRLVRAHVNERMNTKSVITRYIARQALMKRYGITHFRAFENLSNSIADKRASLKAKLIENTVGKIAPKASTYLACLSGGSTCEKLKDSIRSGIDESEQKTGESNADYEKRKAKNDAYKKAIGESVDVPGEGQMAKYISRQLVTKIGVGVGIAGAVDMIMRGVASADNGALESVVYDIRSQAAVGYAFGDEAGIIPNIEKVKAGESDDPDIMSLLAEQFENVEKSPVFQAETGLLAKGSEGGFTRTCENENGDKVDVVLTDNYVCPERQVIQDVSGFMDNPFMETLAILASAWRDSVGILFDVADNATSWAFDHLGINGLIENVFGNEFERLAGWLIGLFFDVPTMGDEATGDENYDTLSAGVWISQNGLMENGVEGSDLLGGGGKLLKTEEIVAIQSEQRGQELEQFNNQSYLARMFSPDLSDSFINRFLARIPVATFTNTASIFSLPSAAFGSLSSSLSPAAQANSGPLNPHNLPLYGYAPNDPIFEAAPSDPMFTDEQCKISAEKRQDSYDFSEDYSINIKAYQETDPCALERLAIGNILHDMGVTDDKHSFKSPVASSASNYADTSNWPTAEALNALVERAEKGTGNPSPLHGKGEEFIRLGKKYGINPGIVAAILYRESQMGADGSVLPNQYNNFAGITDAGGNAPGTCGSTPVVVDRTWKNYCTPEEGLEGVFQILDLDIYRETGGIMSEVMELYSPKFENDWDDMWNIFHTVAKELKISIELTTNIYSSGPAAGGVGNTAGLAGIYLSNAVHNIYVFGPNSDNGLYGYGTDYGLNGLQHTGTDIVMDPEAPIYSPVSGVITCSATNVGPGTNGSGCGAFNSYQPGTNNTVVNGTGRIEIELDNGDALILGHTLTSLVRVGQRVNVGDQVGTNGFMNSWHVHVEYRTPDPDLPSGWRVIDPGTALGGGRTPV